MGRDIKLMREEVRDKKWNESDENKESMKRE